MLAFDGKKRENARYNLILKITVVEAWLFETLSKS